MKTKVSLLSLRKDTLGNTWYVIKMKVWFLFLENQFV
jgi:hypothetical protein